VLFTARSEGNLSSAAGDRAGEAAASRERLRERIGVRELARGYQVHGTLVSRVEEPPAPGCTGRGGRPEPDADGQATALPGLGVMVLSADCLPVAIAGNGAVAMVHAGWRGLAAGVLESGVEAIAELGGGNRPLAAVGPCAGVCCYEVGEEVHRAFRGAHRHHRNIDLRTIAHERLLAAGVSDVLDVAACTICDERFFSHRREGRRAGRQGGVAWLS
jgi:purine-nucleoside/S-methyl-5'-thioadenosine phosphorylase / adenosine deaminase